MSVKKSMHFESIPGYVIGLLSLYYGFDEHQWDCHQKAIGILKAGYFRNGNNSIDNSLYKTDWLLSNFPLEVVDI